MLGEVTDSGASFWVRTAAPAEVRIRIGGKVSQVVKTSAGSDFTAVAKITGLDSATAYDYKVLIDGKVVETFTLPISKLR